MKYILYTLFGILFIGLHSCSSDTTQDLAQEAPVLVQTQKISQENSPQPTFSVSGKIVASQTSNVSTRVMGYITKINVGVGQKVRKGQSLIHIHNADIQAKENQINAQISQAQVNYNLSQKDYQRFKNLFENQSASQKELDDMTARMQMAEANLQAAQQMKNEIRTQYVYTNITAPISGVITQKLVNESDMAHPGMPLLTIESSSNIQAEVMVSESQINQVEKGMKVKIKQSNSEELLEGEVNEISYSAVQTGGQYLVKIDVDAAHFLPGMYVNAIFPFQRQVNDHSESERFFVPKDALISHGQLKGIYAVSQSQTAVLRWVVTGQETENQIEVLSGLGSDEDYILSSEGKLYNGVPVQIQ